MRTVFQPFVLLSWASVCGAAVAGEEFTRERCAATKGGRFAQPLAIGCDGSAIQGGGRFLLEGEDGARRGIRTPDQLGVKGLLNLCYCGVKILCFPR